MAQTSRTDTRWYLAGSALLVASPRGIVMCDPTTSLDVVSWLWDNLAQGTDPRSLVGTAVEMLPVGARNLACVFTDGAATVSFSTGTLTVSCDGQPCPPEQWTSLPRTSAASATWHVADASSTEADQLAPRLPIVEGVVLARNATWTVPGAPTASIPSHQDQVSAPSTTATPAPPLRPKPTVPPPVPVWEGRVSAQSGADELEATVLTTDLVALRRRLANWPDDAVPGPFAVPEPQRPQRPAHTIAELQLSNGSIVPLDRPAVLGRAPSRRGIPVPDVRLVTVPSPHKDISRNHALIYVDGGQVVVRDLHSTNGVWVISPAGERRRIVPDQDVPLGPGATIDLGDGLTCVVAWPQ